MNPRSRDLTDPAFRSDRNGAHDVADRIAAPRRRYLAEMRSAAEMQAEIEAWRELARRAIEPNVFAEPELVLPGIQHLPDGRGVTLLLVWEGPAATAEGGMLRAVWPVAMPRHGLARHVALWSPGPGSSAVPLVDSTAPADIIETALDHLAERATRRTGLALSQVPTDGAFAAALRSAATRTGRQLRPVATGRRRVLVTAGLDAAVEPMRRAVVDALRDGRQRLSTLGGVEMDHARSARWIRDAVEELLVLDATGSVTGRRDALLGTSGMASFIRIATRQLAGDGRCRVDCLRMDGRAVAAAIIIESAGQAWLWHVAAEAGLADAAPATQLLLDVTRTQLDRPGFARTEACMAPSAPVIDALWSEQTTADYVMAIRPLWQPATLAARIGAGLRRHLQHSTREPLARPARLRSDARFTLRRGARAVFDL
jgi:Acetyltransferase (GNAT) domain